MRTRHAILRLTLRAGLLGGLLLGALAPRAQQAHAPADRFKQDRFAIGFWVDPPADARMDQRYREIAAANFTLVLGGFSATAPEQIQRQLELCQKYGLKALVSVPGGLSKSPEVAPARLADGPACWGYLLRDEPSAKDFPALAQTVAAVRRARPGHLAYINLFPGYASPGTLGTPTYDKYVGRFTDEVKPDVLSMDHYPLFRPGEPDGRDGYCADLAVMRAQALRVGIPFWNFFNTMPFGHQTDPTEDQLRWQVYASVAYGAKGVLYFCYYTPLSPEFPKGGAILTRDGRLTRHYAQARRLNAELKNLGPTLMKLTSTRVARLKPGDDPAAVLRGSAIRTIGGAPGDPKPDYLIGEFRHADGRRAVLLMNYNFAYTAWPTVEFDAPTTQVMEVDKATGQEHAVRDDSPDQAGLQLSLDAGEGRLFLLPAAAK